MFDNLACAPHGDRMPALALPRSPACNPFCHGSQRLRTAREISERQGASRRYDNATVDQAKPAASDCGSLKRFFRDFSGQSFGIGKVLDSGHSIPRRTYFMNSI